MRGFIWGNSTLLVMILVSLNFPVVRVEVAKVLANTSEFLYDSVDQDKFDVDYWFNKLNNE